AIRERNGTTVSVKKIFKEYGIVPDVISVAPTKLVNVSYNNLTVNLGNELTPTQVKDQPTEVLWNARPKCLYTLAFIDPDAPSRRNHTYREFKHWLVTNIPGQNISEGEVLAEYVGAGAPKGTGFHRYVFLVYKQPGV
ncbi:unnamed protein product, partial [Onchocerca ochengi]